MKKIEIKYTDPKDYKFDKRDFDLRTKINELVKEVNKLKLTLNEK